MIDIEDKSYQPNIDEISRFIENRLFDELYCYIKDEYDALCKIEYSGDHVLLGWNVKLKKAGRTLCTVYPRKGYFLMLLVVGRREEQRVGALMPTFSDEFQEIYRSTKQGMGQRWIVINLASHTPVYDDALRIIRIRRQSK